MKPSTADQISNKIRLSWNSPMGEDLIYILVEGPDDCKVYKKFITDKARVEFIEGKGEGEGGGKVLKTVEQLRQVSNQIIGICDADFERLMGSVSEKEYLFFTDYHDIEMTMLSIEGVLHNVLCEYGLDEQATPIKNTALQLGSRFAYWRWYNKINADSIKFQGLPFGNLVEVDSFIFHVNETALVEELNKRRLDKKTTISKETLRNFEDQYATTDLLNLCNGHDIAAIIALMISNKTRDKKPTAKKIEESLRLSFQLPHFKQTALYTKLHQWQENQNIRILRAEIT